MRNGNQHTIRFHVDDLLSSHKDSAVNDDFYAWAQEKYGKLKPVTFHKGDKHNFLGMELDFSEDGVCHVRQEEHIDEMINEWPEKFENCAKVLTPASNSLYELGGGGLLNDEKAKTFH